MKYNSFVEKIAEQKELAAIEDYRHLLEKK